MTRMLLSIPSPSSMKMIDLWSSSNWWEEINESRSWQDGIFFTLCAFYALVSAIALIQLIRIEVRVPEYGWTTQKVFHLMNFIVNGVRAIVFGFHMQVFNLPLKVSMLFGSGCYWKFRDYFSFQLILSLSYFGRRYITRQARSLPTDKLRITYVCVNVGVYVVQGCIWIYLWVDDSSTVQFVGKIFIAVVSFMAALGFLLYGGRLFFMLRRFPIESKGRRKKLHEVGSVTAICFTCFVVRCFVDVVSAFDSEVSLDVLDHPVLNLIFYMVVEILPSALVLYILRKLPPKRVSAQYHPIH
ncbi:hypothetical protein Ccrd_001002 [Cynara cardunculus var. scolymus]|uniref:THH1/TOM1/TOM3 domain-containing protein n=1 Tax=Cynara cardunculus var. scolymus TaxID=59895 RepID=A0A103XU29_CYNCS|nr:hypothetical protein Ccrd_001002 [Cynara cardunculus var. scolymus]